MVFADAYDLANELENAIREMSDKNANSIWEGVFHQIVANAKSRAYDYYYDVIITSVRIALEKDYSRTLQTLMRIVDELSNESLFLFALLAHWDRNIHSLRDNNGNIPHIRSPHTVTFNEIGAIITCVNRISARDIGIHHALAHIRVLSPLYFRVDAETFSDHELTQRLKPLITALLSIRQ